MLDELKPLSAGEMERRNEAAKKALRIVRKFPQLEQEVLVPMLAREIGWAILHEQDASADQIRELSKRVAALEADRARLTEALAPFAARSASFRGRYGEYARLDDTVSTTLAECDAARAAIDAMPEPAGEGGRAE